MLIEKFFGPEDKKSPKIPLDFIRKFFGPFNRIKSRVDCITFPGHALLYFPLKSLPSIYPKNSKFNPLNHILPNFNQKKPKKSTQNNVLKTHPYLPTTLALFFPPITVRACVAGVLKSKNFM
jgi:hypothetical protein